MSVTDPKFNPSNSAAIDQIKVSGLLLEGIIKQYTPPSRRQSVALTHLETALMWAVKAASVADD